MLNSNLWARAALVVSAIACAASAHANTRKTGFERGAAASITSIDVLEVVQQQPLMVLPRTAHLEGAPIPPAKADAVTPTVGNPRAMHENLQQGTTKLNEGFARQNSSLSTEFRKQLVDALRAAGYDAKALNGQQPSEKSIGHRQTIAGVKSNADAVLYVVVRFAGYKDDAASGGLVPMVGADAYLFGNKDGKLLYRQVFNAGYKLVKDDDVEYPALPAQNKFSNRAALMSNAEAGARGLVQALQPVASRIAQQLGK